METFGLPVPPGNSQEDVQQKIADNSAKIVPIVNSVMSQVDKQGQEFASKTQKVVNRLYNSINGHIKRQKAIIANVAGAAMTPVMQGIETANAKLAGALTDPAISAFVRAQPGSPYLPLVDPPETPPAGGQSYTTVGTGPQGCPPGWTQAGGGMCIYCPPGADVGACQPVPLVQAWALYDAQQRSIGSMGVTSPPSPPPSPPLSPSPSPPPSPPLSPVTVSPVASPPLSPSGGGTPVTTAAAEGGGGALGCPPGWLATGDGRCFCPTAGPGAVIPVMPSVAWQQYAQGVCGQVALPPAPPSPPAGGGTTVTAGQCPQSYTIIQGPPCPQYLAVLGTPASWIAAGFQLPVGWSALQVVTDTPANVSKLINSLVQQCVVTTLPPPPPPPAP